MSSPPHRETYFFDNLKRQQQSDEEFNLPDRNLGENSDLRNITQRRRPQTVDLANLKTEKTSISELQKIKPTNPILKSLPNLKVQRLVFKILNIPKNRKTEKIKWQC